MHVPCFPRWMIGFLVAASLLSGCGLSPAGLGGGNSSARARAVSTSAQPTFEQAFLAAYKAASLEASGPVFLQSANGDGVDLEGRLQNERELSHRGTSRASTVRAAWQFIFAAEGDRSEPFGIRVSPSGELSDFTPLVQTSGPISRWGIKPGDLVALRTALRTAAANGFRGQVFSVGLKRAEAAFGSDTVQTTFTYFFQAQDYQGPNPALQVDALSGQAMGLVSPGDRLQLQSVVQAFVAQWSAMLTGGLDRPISRQDLMATGATAQSINAFMAGADTDGDGRVSQGELLAYVGRTNFYAWFRDGLLLAGFWSADSDQDGRLTPAEAQQAAVSFGGGQALVLNLKISSADAVAADLNRDGWMSPKEYLPLAARKVQALFQADPAALSRLGNMILSGEALPWAH